jgi:hypothetical protein
MKAEEILRNKRWEKKQGNSCYLDSNKDSIGTTRPINALIK